MPAFCFLAAAPMRKEPSDASEMVNQLLFGDSADVIETTPKWLLVRSLFDDYVGWVDSKQLEITETCPTLDIVVPSPFCDITYRGLQLALPLGSCCRREWLAEPLPTTNAGHASLVDVAMQLLGAPYLWGGRTPMGIDCSGLVQVCAKVCGIKLPRDASQQALCGHPVSLSDSRNGDLAFFANDKGSIIHVGIVAGDGTIVHASGRVRRDPLDDTGIFDTERHCYSHRLAFLRRL